MTLQELRKQREKGLCPIIEIWPALENSLTVVLSDENSGYHVHHYMQARDGWDVSADLQRGSHEEVVDVLAMRHGPEE